MLSYQVFMNPRGYSVSMAFDSPEAYLKYAVAEAQFNNDTSVGQAHKESSRLLFNQAVGFKEDIKYVITRTNDNYFGVPNLYMWGGVGAFGIVSGSAAPIEVGPKESFVMIPVLDLIAAGMNFDRWGTTEDDWQLAYYAQGATGVSALLLWAGSLLMGDGLLLLYSKLHILLEAACLGLVWSAQSSDPNTTTSATNISYAAGIFGIVGSIVLNAADMYGPGI